MLIRNYQQKDKKEVRSICSQYWTDKFFLDEIADRLDKSLSKNEKHPNGRSMFYIAEREGQIVGVVGIVDVPDYLTPYVKTQKPIELYILASKYKKQGIGSALGQYIIQEAQKTEFTEIVCYSPETHKESWSFYEKLGLNKLGIINDPEGYPGTLWQKTLGFTPAGYTVSPYSR